MENFSNHKVKFKQKGGRFISHYGDVRGNVWAELGARFVAKQLSTDSRQWKHQIISSSIHSASDCAREMFAALFVILLKSIMLEVPSFWVAIIKQTDIHYEIEADMKFPKSILSSVISLKLFGVH